MATRQLNTVIQHLRWAVLLQAGAEMTDGQLVESFIAGKDEAGFEANAAEGSRTRSPTRWRIVVAGGGRVYGKCCRSR